MRARRPVRRGASCPCPAVRASSAACARAAATPLGGGSAGAVGRPSAAWYRAAAPIPRRGKRAAETPPKTRRANRSTHGSCFLPRWVAGRDGLRWCVEEKRSDGRRRV
eukprot:scaffold85517_cov32-Tisochrysis_lutea.AAC.6